MDEILIHLNYLGESSQQELNAYRRLGTVQYLKHLKYKEIRRTRRAKLLLKALEKIGIGASALFHLWVFISWMDVLAHNMNQNHVYQMWNFFALFF